MHKRLVSALCLVVATAGCGGGDSEPSPSTGINTLAYVVTECHENARQITARQALKIRRRSGETITVLELPQIGPLPSLGLCSLYAQVRLGEGSVVALPFQRLGVSPDGSIVIFEVNAEVSVLAPILTQPLIPPELNGIYLVHEDGSGLRRVAAASREPSFRFFLDPSEPLGFSGGTAPNFSFRPDGRAIAFTDLGPDANGVITTQVVTLDLATGRRTQVTSLPPLLQFAGGAPQVGPPEYLDAHTIIVRTLAANADDNSIADVDVLVLKADGTGLIRRLPHLVANPNGILDPRFFITSGTLVVGTLPVAGPPMDPSPGHIPAVEVFGSRDQTLLQLTTFQRSETAAGLVSRDQQRVLFTASADPSGINPEGTCQVFSVGALGGDLRQLTRFSSRHPSTGGCGFNFALGCAVRLVHQELASDSALFTTNCDPLGTDANGAAFFSMQFDGSDLTQLTNTRGVTMEADGSVTAELPGPSAYPEAFR